ncbi:MAG: hypothetical protein LBS55_14715, partial [Prevotellaceae bacterium]|nr:hypothetical protein [Prevotellaceae bacterium]
PAGPAGRYIRGRICRDGACTVSTGHEIEPLHAIYFACLNAFCPQTGQSKKHHRKQGTVSKVVFFCHGGLDPPSPDVR